MENPEFEYDAMVRLEHQTIYMTEDAVAENIEMNVGEITSDAYCGVRLVPDEGDSTDLEVFGRTGESVIDICFLDGSGKELEEVELAIPLGEDREELLRSIAKVIV